MKKYLSCGASLLVIIFSASSLNAGMVGITYNEATMHNEVRGIDVTSGATLLLQSFDFNTGAWQPPIVADPSGDRFYAQSSDGMLYTFDALTGQTLSTAPLDTYMQSFVAMTSGIVGITYNEATRHNEVHQLDPTSGATTLLQSFDEPLRRFYFSLYKRASFFN